MISMSAPQGILPRLGFCLVVFALCLYSYLNKQNELTHVQIRLPELEKEIKKIREETERLQYEIDRFENPTRLIELAHHPEFSHLKHPLMKEILTVPEGIALQSEGENSSKLW